MMTFTVKRSFKMAALALLAFLTVQSTSFSPMMNHAVARAASTSSSTSSSSLYFKPSSSSPPDTSSTSSSSGAASPTKAAAAASIAGEFSASSISSTGSSREAVLASRIATTLSRKTRRATTTSSTISQQQIQQQQTTVSISTELPIYQLALAGGVTTALADLVTHPIDCIKTIQQSDLGMDWSIVQTASYIQETFGLSGFFYGFCTYAICDAVGGAIKFSVWELWKKHAKSVVVYVSMPFSSAPSSVESSSMDLTWLGPALAFVASSIVIVPGEFLKQQLQMAHYDNVWQAVLSVYSTSGLPGFFAGYDGVLLRDIPYTMLELGMYEVFKNFIQSQKRGNNENGMNQKQDDSVMDQVLAAALTGAIVAMFTTPMDVIKTKLMVDSYVSYADCLVTTIQNHGLASLYSGGMARLAWIVPFTAIYLPTYDFLKQQLLQRHLASSSFQEQEAAAATRISTSTFTAATVTSPLETV